jgi:hypothetical protein
MAGNLLEDHMQEDTWKNWPTQCVAITLFNDRENHYQAHRLSRADKLWTDPSDVPDPGEQLKEWVTEVVSPEPDIDVPFVRDAWSAFMQEVDWDEVAAYFKGNAYFASSDEENADVVDAAAAAVFGEDLLDTFYEHGSWHVRVEDPSNEETGETVYNVVDVIPGVSHGLDFEKV